MFVLSSISVMSNSRKEKCSILEQNSSEFMAFTAPSWQQLDLRDELLFSSFTIKWVFHPHISSFTDVKYFVFLMWEFPPTSKHFLCVISLEL